MPELIKLNTISDERGCLTVIEKCLPFEIKRVFYIYNVDHSIRGKHRHKITVQAAVCLSGSCKIFCDDGRNQSMYKLDQKTECLILQPEDYHYMYDFTKDAVLMVLASENYDPKDYIFKSYENTIWGPKQVEFALYGRNENGV